MRNESRIIRSAIGSIASNGLLKFFKKSGFYTIGTDISDFSAGRFLVDRFEKVPPAIENEKVIERYLELLERYNPNWIISGPENEILALSQNSLLSSKLFHPPLETLTTITDKWKLYEFLTPKGVQLPFSSIDSTIDIDSGELILKPRIGRGSQGIVEVKRNELKHHSLSQELIVQEKIIGTEYSVDTLHGYEGNLTNVVIRERVQTSSGISVIGKTLNDQVIVEIITRISELLRFRGVSCFQFIKKDSQYYLIDVNPRFGGGAILSINASKSFRENTVSMLNCDYGNLDQLTIDTEEITMYRGYEEFYSRSSFDLDNTLYDEISYFKLVIDSLPDSHFNSIEKQIMLENIEDTRLQSKDIIGSLLELIDKNDSLFHNLFFSKYVSPPKIDVPISKSTLDTINELKTRNMKLGLLTNGIIEVQRSKIDRLGISQLFDSVIFARSWGSLLEKPHRKSFEMMMKSLRLNWDEIVFVGDNPNLDFKVPKSEGSITIRVLKGSYKSIPSNSNIDIEILNVSEILNWI